jgi:hypothetical protein
MRILIVDGGGPHPSGSARSLARALRSRGHRVFPLTVGSPPRSGWGRGWFPGFRGEFLHSIHPDIVHILGGEARLADLLSGYGFPVLHATLDPNSRADWVIAPTAQALRSARERRVRHENRVGYLPFALDVSLDPPGPGSFVLLRIPEGDGRASRWGEELGRRIPDVPIRTEGDVREARILVSLASRPGGWPVGVAEAMSAGRPVIASWGGAAQEFVVEGVTGFLSEPGDLSSVTGHIRYLWDQPQEAEALGIQGREDAREHFATERHVPVLLQWYFKAGASRLAV